MNLSSTFLILFAIDQLGFASAGIMASVMLLTQVIFDYPSGSIGDWIGQRWVLVAAFLSHAFAFLLLGAIAESFTSFIIIGIIIGFANAQSSGALETWVDNNYQASIEDEDKERKIYGYSVSRVSTLSIIPSIIAFILGGVLATTISRQFVFFLQVFISIFMVFLILFLVKDGVTIQAKGTDIQAEGETKENYFTFLKGGVSFLFSSKPAFFFIIGIAIYDLVLTIWSTLLLLPLVLCELSFGLHLYRYISTWPKSVLNWTTQSYHWLLHFMLYCFFQAGY